MELKGEAENEEYMNIINMPVKDHILKLEMKIKEVKENLELNKKSKNECRLELISYGDLQNQQRSDLTEFIKQQAKRVGAELQK